MTVQIHPEDVKVGDSFIDTVDGTSVWCALKDARVQGNEVHIDVQYSVDVGCGTRVWEAGGGIKLNIRP